MCVTSAFALVATAHRDVCRDSRKCTRAHRSAASSETAEPHKQVPKKNTAFGCIRSFADARSAPDIAILIALSKAIISCSRRMYKAESERLCHALKRSQLPRQQLTCPPLWQEHRPPETSPQRIAHQVQGVRSRAAHQLRRSQERWVQPLSNSNCP